jgi:hypothetical protein
MVEYSIFAAVLACVPRSICIGDIAPTVLSRESLRSLGDKQSLTSLHEADYPVGSSDTNINAPGRGTVVRRQYGCSRTDLESGMKGMLSGSMMSIVFEDE